MTDYDFRIASDETGYIANANHGEINSIHDAEACVFDLSPDDPRGAKLAAEIVRRWNTLPDLQAENTRLRAALTALLSMTDHVRFNHMAAANLYVEFVKEARTALNPNAAISEKPNPKGYSRQCSRCNEEATVFAGKFFCAKHAHPKREWPDAHSTPVISDELLDSLVRQREARRVEEAGK